MVLYNTSALEAANNPYTIATAVNNLAGGIIAGLFLLLATIFLLVIFRNTAPFKRVLLGVFTMVSLIAVFLWAINWVTVHIVVIPLVLLMFTLIYNIWGG